MIPQSFIDDLLARTDIVELIGSYVPLRKAGRDYQALCPFHSEKTPSFTVSPSKQFYYCFGCGASGSALGFLMDYAQLDFRAAVAELAERAGIEVPEDDRGGAAPHRPHAALYAALDAAQRHFAAALRQHPQASRAVEYLKRRGIHGRVAAHYGLGYAPPGWEGLTQALQAQGFALETLVEAGLVVAREGRHYDRFRDRVTFPIQDGRGRTLGFGARVIDQGEPKYLNSPETPVFHKGQELFGLPQARQAIGERGEVLVVEGYMDVLSLAGAGVGWAVATLGTATTREHLQRLFRVSARVVFCFDGDAAGRRAAWRALTTTLPLLTGERSAGFLFLPEGEDPDSLARSAGSAPFTERDRVIPLAEFMLAELTRQAPPGTIDGRARLVELARPLLAELPDGALRRLLVHRLSELARLPDAELAAMLGAAGVPAATGRQRPARRGPSLVRRAVTLVLHYPSLAASLPATTSLREAPAPGAELLSQLIEFARQNPQISPAGMVEHWRGTEHHTALSKLLAEPQPLPLEGARAELEQAVARLLQQARSARRTPLVAQRPSEMSEEAKERLRAELAASGSATGTRTPK